MKRPLAILVFAALVAGTAPGAAAAEPQPQAQRRAAIGQRLAQQRPALQNRPVLRQRLVRQLQMRRTMQMLRRLDLTPAQHEQIRGLRGQRRDALKGILTPEQFQRLERLRKRRGGGR